MEFNESFDVSVKLMNCTQHFENHVGPVDLPSVAKRVYKDSSRNLLPVELSELKPLRKGISCETFLDDD